MNSPYVAAPIDPGLCSEGAWPPGKGQTLHHPAANVAPVIESVYRDSKNKKLNDNTGKATDRQTDRQERRRIKGYELRACTWWSCLPPGLHPLWCCGAVGPDQADQDHPDDPLMRIISNLLQPWQNQAAAANFALRRSISSHRRLSKSLRPDWPGVSLLARTAAFPRRLFICAAVVFGLLLLFLSPPPP